MTNYEISRATGAGGVGSAVGTVNAGVVKYNDTTAGAGTTYYYKVRAVAGSEYLPYTAEATGKRYVISGSFLPIPAKTSNLESGHSSTADHIGPILAFYIVFVSKIC